MSNEPLKESEQLTLQNRASGYCFYETKFLTVIAICEVALSKYFGTVPKKLYFYFEQK